MLSPHDREHIGDIVAGYGTWFTADLLRLCAHADTENLRRLHRVFPDVVDAFTMWKRGTTLAGAEYDGWANPDAVRAAQAFRDVASAGVEYGTSEFEAARSQLIALGADLADLVLGGSSAQPAADREGGHAQ